MKSIGMALLGAALAFSVAAPASAQVDSKCLAAKYKAAGKRLSQEAACHAKAASKGVVVDPACLAKAQAKFATAFGKAEGKTDCVETGDQGVTEDVLEELAEDLERTLSNSGGTCCVLGSQCFFADDATDCSLHSGTPGSEGSVCGSGGTCVAPPATPGACCEGTSFGLGCLAGVIDGGGCMVVGGAFSPSAVCQPSGLCKAP
jgi:hypothetical protein